MNMAKPKHRFKDEPPKTKARPAFAIGFLIFCSLVLCGTLIFAFAANNERNTTPTETTEPMTMGIVLIDDNGETVIPTSPPTTKPTVKSTEPPTEKPTEKPVEVEAEEDVDSEPEKDTYIAPDPTDQAPNPVTGLLAAHHLIDIDNPDPDYVPTEITLSDYDREQAARVIMGEVGGAGYGSACLVAQCLRDTMVYEGFTSIDQVISEYQYYGFNSNPDEDCYVALDYVFGGGMAVEHRILYFYAPSQGASAWHESQNLVVDFRGMRFFDTWY